MRLSSVFAGLGLVAVVSGAIFYTLTIPAHAPQFGSVTRTADLGNGETIFGISGCASCHSTPKQPDRTRLGGGLALVTPYGAFKVPNISSDLKEGIGSWTEQEFANAILRGTGRKGEHLYPAFPYTSYQRMTIVDVRDLFAFLKTLPADSSPSEPHELRFPFNVRRGLGLWKLLFLDGTTFAPNLSQDAVFNRGAYLVEGPGHCAECHSPRKVLGAIDPERRFAGGIDIEGTGWVPNITSHPDGILTWSESDIVYLLENGFTPTFKPVGASMADVVENTAKLSAADRAAIARYLKALPPREGKRKPRS